MCGFGLALVMLLIIGWVVFRSLNLLIDNTAQVMHTYQVLDGLEGILSLLKDAETGQRGYLLTRRKSYLEPYENAKIQFQERKIKLGQLAEGNPTQQATLAKLEQLCGKKFAELQDTIDMRSQDDETTELDKAKGLKAALEIVRSDKGKGYMDEIRAVVNEMATEENRLLAKRREDEKLSTFYAQMTIVFGKLMVAVILILTGIALTRSISRPLLAVMERAQEIAAGNLQQEKLVVQSDDEIGRLTASFNGMLISLQELTRQTLMVTNSLNASTAQITASTQEQAASTREQAATVQQVTATMEEVGQSSQQISTRAKQVAAAAEATSSASTSGLQSVQETTRTMDAIREQVEEVAENIVGLSEKTQAVGEIIATVNDIAERSNLLALNAAIEAAAAGEQGNRFSVVANEMKNLADQAKESTIQVRTILGDIQKGINSSVMLTEEAVKRSEAGKQQADVAEKTIRQLARNTVESVQAFEQIIGANNQQQIGFEQVAQGMKDIRQAATQTVTATSQLEKAVLNLNALSRELQTTVGRYQI